MKAMKKISSIISIALCLVIITSMFCMTVYAEDTAIFDNYDYSTCDGDDHLSYEEYNSHLEDLNLVNEQNAFAAAYCLGHRFATFARGIYGYDTSVHNVTYNGKTTSCTIITTIYILEDVCQNCGYSGGTYLGSMHSHSVPH